MTTAKAGSLPALFQRHFDTEIMKGGDPKVACCHRLRQLSLADADIGPALGAIAREHFRCNAEQVEALSSWPPAQLRIFAGALAEAIGCPRPPLPGPDPIATRFIGEEKEGAPPAIQVTMIGGDQLEIRFIAPRIP